jgi:hypothetical protein
MRLRKGEIEEKERAGKIKVDMKGKAWKGEACGGHREDDTGQERHREERCWDRGYRNTGRIRGE